MGIGAPYAVDNNIMEHFNVDLVVHGSTSIINDQFGNDPYEVPKANGKYMNLPSGNDMSTELIIHRIIQNRLRYKERNKKKEQKEIAAYKAEQQRKKNANGQ